MKAVALLVGLAASGAFAMGPCDSFPGPCGVNTDCTESRSGLAVCRCKPGWDHAPGSHTIDGCPVRATGRKSAPNFHSRTPSRPVVQTLGNRLGNNRFGVVRGSGNEVRGDPCSIDPCGQNTACRSAGNRAVCSCLPNHIGDPYTNCRPDGCLSNPCGTNAECISRGADYECRCPPGFSGNPRVSCNDNPCTRDHSPCAPNARCEVRGNQAICTCPEGYGGDPFIECLLDPCLNSPCGVNAECQARTGARSANCVCNSGYTGDPYTRCNLDPCYNDPCGQNSRCEARGNSATCICDRGYTHERPGDLSSGCVPAPCENSECGINAQCTPRGRSAICSCPEGFTGDPYTRCDPDPCSQEPCGLNAICENKVSRSGDAAGFQCDCPPSHVGDPYSRSGCRFDPCADDPCGPNTECQASGERAVCRCVRGFVGSPESRSGCRSDPCSVSNSCGQGAECRNEVDRRSGSDSMRPVCYCPPRHVGNPYDRCIPGECIGNSECGPNEACQDYRCVDPCSTACAQGADCSVQNHVAICRCPRGFTGDPFDTCRRFTREEICAPCGANTDCEVGPDDRPICRCKPNFIGNPLTGCNYECETDRDCNTQQKCQAYRCAAVCDQDACGDNANCVARNNRAQCTCPTDFLGDPYTRCYTECTRHDDCGQDQACVKFKCVDPCYVPDNVCGTQAQCEVRRHKPICSCPKDFTGDPFVSCRPFDRGDLCDRDTCGVDARCQPGVDRRGDDRPVCTCPPGYRGDPLVRCIRGECESDSECSSNLGCYDYRCQDPCLKGEVCGVAADCRARNHAAVCTCPEGYVGDPLTACRISRNGSQQRIRGHSRFRRAIRVNKKLH